MRRCAHRLAHGLGFATLLLAGCAAAQPQYALEPVVTGLEQPLGMTTVPDGSGRLFVIEKGGRVRVVQDGALLDAPFLDLSAKVATNSERGLLDIAFSPDYPEVNRVFVHYSDAEGNTTLSVFAAAEDGSRLLPESEQVLLTVAQPYANHNGGELAFGPDGYLYLGLGDGGSGGDPQGNGQNLGTLLGKLLRLDVSEAALAEGGYAVPTDNPFAASDDARPEIWAYGLRNPWRFSFDRETGELWIADVGQNRWEEVNRQSAGSPGGENYGWNVMEGRHCFSQDNCDQSDLVLPVLEYGRDAGISITGGYVYRGTALPELVGSYLFGDFGSGLIWRAVGSGDDLAPELLLESGMAISSFGEDEAGELYVVDFAGGLYRLVAR